MIRCIAIDDEPLALKQIERYIGRLPDVELAGSYYSALQAKEGLDCANSTERVDVILLDVEMPDCNGVDFARQLGENHPYIIFTTAYPQFAVDGFRLDAVDYLLKPLSFEQLTEAFERVKRRIAASNTTSREKAFIYVKDSGTMRRIAIDDILYIKGLGEYVQIYLRGEAAPVVTFEAIKRLETELTPHAFMRVHKSYLINLQAIDAASRTSAEINSEHIPIGEKYRTEYIQYIKAQSNKKR